jgi:hypothetical protein
VLSSSSSSSSSQQLPEHAVKECHYDPHTTATTTADVGILSCGLFQYCKESSQSKLGGVCATDQSLQQRLNQKWDIVTNGDGRGGGNSRLMNTIKTPAADTHQQQECDPTADVVDATDSGSISTDTDADVGILSSLSLCGPYQYCYQSNDSPLGGFCVDFYQEQPLFPNVFSQNPRKLKQIHHRFLSRSNSGLRSSSSTRNLHMMDYEGFHHLSYVLCADSNLTCTVCSYDEGAVSAHFFDCSYVEPVCNSFPAVTI